MAQPTTYTIPTTKVYRTPDGAQSIRWTAGTVISYAQALRFGLVPALDPEPSTESQILEHGPLGSGSVTRAALAPDVRAAVANGARRGNRVVPLGNSIIASSGSGTSYPVAGWIGKLAMISGGRVRLVGWAAQGGAKTADLLARFDVDVAPQRPDYVIVQEITNDATASSGVTFAQTKANLIAIWEKCDAIGALPIQIGPPPKSADMAEVTRRATWCREACRDRGIPYVDIMPPLINPETGAMQAAYTSDGTHPNDAGSQIIADTVWSAIAPLFPAEGAVALPLWNGDPTNLIPNGLFADTNADGLADGLTKNGVFTPSIVAGSGDVVGNWQVFGGISGGAYLSFVIATGFSSGDRLLFSGRADIKSTSTSGFPSIRIGFGSLGNIAASFGSFTSDINGVFATEVVVPPDASQLYAVAFLGVLETNEVRIAQWSIRNLTALGLA